MKIKIKLKNPNNTNVISMIKSLRSATNFGLKEAKDIVYNLRILNSYKEIELLNFDNTSEFNEYFLVKNESEDIKNNLINQMKKLAAKSLYAGQYDLSIDIISLIKKY